MKVLLLSAVFFSLVQGNSDKWDRPLGIRNTVCLMQYGHCRLFMCHSGERKGDICSDYWNRCCIPISFEN
uniref:Sperm associated antigen 11A n=1 Tax=Cricetulus griseus TaxID=10029 RepID=A0A8C2LS60_CRIGR